MKPHIRPAFIVAMNREIEANEHKGPWEDYVPSSCYVAPWLEEHVSKLILAVARKDRAKVREYAADVANIAMKIDETFGPK